MKKNIPIFFFVIAILLLPGCNSSRLVIRWEGEHFTGSFNKILVVGIVKDGDGFVRLQMEENMVNEIRNLGYNAVSSIDEFGPHGLANMTQEKTYIQLCDKGIDAVITVAVIDRSKEDSRKSNGVSDNYYYYDRIWNYKDIQADLTGTEEHSPGSYVSECILFNLQTLETEFSVQSKPYNTISQNQMIREFESNVVKLMIRQKIFSRNLKSPKKAF